MNQTYKANHQKKAMSLIPNHLKELSIIDEVLGAFMHSKLDFKNDFFYIPDEKTAQLIAHTFDIDISNLTFYQAKKLLKTPMRSKSRIGTKEAIRDGISKIFGEVVIQTNKEDKKLRPFEFSIKAKITQNIDENVINAINNIILELKPMRDNLAGLDFSMPTAEKNIHFKTSILWRL